MELVTYENEKLLISRDGVIKEFYWADKNWNYQSQWIFFIELDLNRVYGKRDYLKFFSFKIIPRLKSNLIGEFMVCELYLSNGYFCRVINLGSPLSVFSENVKLLKV